jgi:peptidoglycan-associated lipoprotein
MKLLDLKKQLLGVPVLITVGLFGCSNPNLNSEISSASGSVLETNQTQTSITLKPAEDNHSTVVLLTYFGFDSAALSTETTMALDSAVDKFATDPSAIVVISGHADERGTREYNLALGHLRASAVADYMVAKGIDGSRIKKVSYGKEKPLLKGSTEEAWSKNRRVEINGE